MKARIKITVMLMSMIIGTLTVSAQSARRGSSEQKRTTSSSKTYKKPTQKSNSSVARKTQTSRKALTAKRSSSQQGSQPARVQRTSSTQRNKSTVTQRTSQPPRSKTTQTQRTSKPQSWKTAQTQRTSSSNRGSAVKTSTKRSSAVHTTTRAPKQQATTQRSNTQRVSTTTRHNPKSDYRTSNKTVHVGKTFKDPKPGNRQSTHKVGTKHYNETHFTKHTTVNHRHYYYPASKVRIHIHPMTYRGNYRALYYPRYSDIIWSRSMHRHYVGLYPHYTGWHYNWGYRIQTMSVFDASYNVGEIARVYGRVYGTWYNRETDDLLLFFGGEYPVQTFTMVVPGNVARRYSWRPERYFLGQHISATGLITMFEGKAEMVLKKRAQLDVY